MQDDSAMDHASTSTTPVRPKPLKTYSTGGRGVPNPPTPITPATPKITPSSAHYVRRLIDLPETPIRKRKLTFSPAAKAQTKRIRLLKQKLARKSKKNSLLRNMILKLKNKKWLLGGKLKNAARTIVEMQLRGLAKVSMWTAEERKLSLAMYYKSPSCYRYMRKLGIALPGVRTIRSWLNINKIEVGLNNENYLKHLQDVVETMEEDEKKCVLMFDEMSIKRNLRYNAHSDKIEGYADLGFEERSPDVSNHALVFMLTGLCSRWKLPLCFYLTSDIKVDDLKTIFNSVLAKVFAIGLKPRVTVCDQATTNRALYKSLGVTAAKPWFLYNKEKIFCMFDFPHLTKSIRNNLLNGVFKLKGATISINDIRNAYLLDKRSFSFRCMPKLTDIHLNPNKFQRLSVKLATQLLSRSVACGIRTAVKLGKLVSKTAMNTARFVETMNDLFDAMNSKNLLDENLNRRPLSSRNTHVMKTLQRAIPIFKELKKVCFDTKLGKEVTKRPPCFDGIVLSIEAVIQLYKAEKSSNDKFFCRTNCLSQDSLENFFSVIRQHNGYSRNPSASQFGHLFTSVANFAISRFSEVANCEEDLNEFLTNSVRKKHHSGQSEPQQASSSASEESQNQKYSASPSVKSANKVVKPKSSIDLSDCAENYVGGWAILRAIEKTNCESCHTRLVDYENVSDSRNTLILDKLYAGIDPLGSGGLKKPSKEMGIFIHQAMEVYMKTAPTIMHKELLLQKLVLAVSSLNYPELFPNQCQGHKELILKDIFKLKLYAECKWVTQSLKVKNVNKPNQRLENIKGN